MPCIFLSLSKGSIAQSFFYLKNHPEIRYKVCVCSITDDRNCRKQFEWTNCPLFKLFRYRLWAIGVRSCWSTLLFGERFFSDSLVILQRFSLRPLSSRFLPGTFDRKRFPGILERFLCRSVSGRGSLAFRKCPPNQSGPMCRHSAHSGLRSSRALLWLILPLYEKLFGNARWASG